jgi:uncharacterized protein YfiM (DUF2279 family)
MLHSKYLILFLLLLLISEVQGAKVSEKFTRDALLDSQNRDSAEVKVKKDCACWLGRDKGLHLVGSMIAAVAVGKSAQTFFAKSKDQSLKIGIGVSFGIGLGKEIWDSTKKNNKFSYADLTADVIGILIGSVLLNLE